MTQPNGAPGVPQFLDPTIGGEAGPSPAELAGRFVAMVPTRYDPNAQNFDKTGTAPAVTADVYVLDGGPLVYGAKPKGSPPVPNATHQTQIPQLFRSQIFQQVNIVRALVDAVGRGAVLGVIEQGVGTKGTPPWNLTAIAPTDPRRQLAAQFFGAMAAGAWHQPEPVELNPQPVNAPQYAGPQYATHATSAPAQPQPVYAAPPTAMYGQPTYASQAVAQQAAAPNTPPPGFDAGLWATMSPEQQAYVRNQQAAQGGPAASPMPTPF